MTCKFRHSLYKKVTTEGKMDKIYHFHVFIAIHRDYGLREEFVLLFEISKHLQLLYSEHTAVLCLIYRLANAKFSRSFQLWLHMSVRCPQLRTSCQLTYISV